MYHLSRLDDYLNGAIIHRSSRAFDGISVDLDVINSYLNEGHMGTNYYCYEKNHQHKHIGKQSCRWRFLFHGYSEPGLEIKSYSDWKIHLLSDEFEIYNENHKKIEKSDFFVMIEESISGKQYSIEEVVEGWYDDQGYCFLNSSFS